MGIPMRLKAAMHGDGRGRPFRPAEDRALRAVSLGPGEPPISTMAASADAEHVEQPKRTWVRTRQVGAGAPPPQGDGMQVISRLLKMARTVADLGVAWSGDAYVAMAGMLASQNQPVSQVRDVRRSGAKLKAILGGLLVGAAIPSLALAGPPSVKIGRAPLLSPAQANAYYAGSTVWTDSTGEEGRGSELEEISRLTFSSSALEQARVPDRVFEFVRNSIATTWTYGLTKGARGAVIDRSGTSFDQAQLMVELLRGNEYVASYKIGTIQLTGAQFAAWSGISSATAACELLASGGIPAVINGSTLTDCSYGAAAITQIEVGHAWVSVVIDGAEYVYDPAYKPHDFKTGRNVVADAGLSSGQVLAAAGSGMQSGADAATLVPYVRQANADGVKIQLDAYAQGVQTAIQANVPAGSAEDLVGGALIQPVVVPSGGMWRQTTLPYPSTVARTFSAPAMSEPTVGNLPDKYRTKLQIRLIAETPDGEALNKVLFVDQIYGRRLQFEPTYNTQSGQGIMGRLMLRDDFQPEVELQQTLPALSTAAGGRILMNVDMPYAAASNGVAGDYMDAVFDRRLVFAMPHVIVHGWGKTDAELIDRIGSSKDLVMPQVIPPACETCVPEYRSTKGDARRQLLAASWLAQSSRAGDLHAEIAKSIYTHHYSIGVVAADTRLKSTVYDPDLPSQSTRFSIADNFDRMDIDSGVSLTSKTSNAADRRAAIQAIAATLEVLEGSVSAQVSDLPDASSASMRFDWGNKPPAAEDNPGGASPGPRRFYAFDGANYVHAQALAKVEGLSSTTQDGRHGQDEPTIGLAETQGRQNQLAQAVTQYATAGFYVFASEEAFLGPGQRAGPYDQQGSTGLMFIHRYSRQRGGALVAKRFDANGDPLEIAHVAIGDGVGSIKGGGGGAQVYHQSQYDPSKAADVLKARFVDRSNAEGIDASSGAVTYVSPASLTVGAGSLPDSLTAQLIWRGGQEQDETFGPISHVQPQAPWTTNWNNSLNISGSGLEAMGKTDVRAMAGTVAAFVALQDVYRSAPSTTRELTGALVSAWWARQLAGNVVTVSVGTDSRQFVRKFDKQWLAAGPGPYATLVQTGERAVTTINDCATSPRYVTTRGWGNDGVSFQVTNANGDVQTFQNWKAQVVGAQSNYCAIQRGFRMTTWAWPKGVTVTLAYETGGSGFTLPQLASVSNNLGRTIRFINSGLGGFNNGLTGADLRSVTVNAPATTGRMTHTDPQGKVTAFDVTLVGDRYQLTSVYTADNASLPEVMFGYDQRGRAQIATDRRAFAGVEGSLTGVLAVDRYEARVFHPLDYANPTFEHYRLSFDATRRLTGYVNELGALTRITRDGRGRITSYTYPELDQEQITYDDRNNPTLMRKVAKPGSPEAATPIEVQASWHPTWNKIASLTDARGATTTFNYFASGGGAGELSSVVRPAVNGASPTYQFTYNGNGLILTSTDPTNIVTGYAYVNSYPSSKSVDPTGVNAVTKYTYDVHGDPIVIDGERSDVPDKTFIKYDKMRRKVLETRPDPGNGRSTSTRTTYDPVGRETLVEQGYVSADTFYPLLATTFEYDVVGNKIRETTPAGLTQFSYDLRDRLICTAKRMNSQGAADACALSGESAFGPDQITKNVYDAASQVTQIITGVGKLDIPFATYQYSPNGQRTAVIDGANNKTTLVYDGHDRLKVQYFPTSTRGAGVHNASDREEYAYDANGNRTSLRKRDAKVIGFGYDALNRVTAKTVATDAAQNVSYGYDLAGRMTSALYSSTAQGVTMTYDTAGRLNTETSYGWTVDVDHDKTGARTRLTWPDGQAIEQLYDPAYRLGQIREPGVTSGLGWLIRFTYDDLGRRVLMTRGNGGKATYDYDFAGRLKTLTQLGAVSSPASLQTLVYTPANQLAGLTQATAAYVWGGHPTVVKDYTHNGLNQDAAIAALGGGFDLNGNLTSSGVRTYAYNVDNRLTQATTAGQTTNITYDPLGRMRSMRTGTGAWTYFLHVGDQLIGEYAGTAANQPPLRRYVHADGIDEPVVWYEGADLSQRRWLHADRQGSIIGVSDAAGAVTPYTYGPYGEPNDWAGPRFRYTGQAALPELQAYHYKARVYDPAMGRFLQTDPIGQDDDPNLYAYVKGDPANNLDPTGQILVAIPAVPVAIGVASGVGAVLAGQCYVSQCITKGIQDGKAAAGAVEDFVRGILKSDSARPSDGLPVQEGATVTRPGKTGVRDQISTKPGGLEGANEDFDKSVDPSTVQDRGNGIRTGKTPDGANITVRPKSDDGRPTVDVSRGNNKERDTDKYRYDKK